MRSQRPMLSVVRARKKQPDLQCLAGVTCWLTKMGSSWNRVGDFGAEGLTKLCISRVFCITAGLGFGINSGWHEQRSAGGDFGIRIGSPGFDRKRQCTAFLAIRKHA